MLKLMKLEYKKHHLSQYFKWVALWIFIIFALVALMGWESKNENELMFRDYADFISLTNILIRIVFICFSAVILSRLVIDEYKNKTIQLLFTYPLQRKKLMQAKLSIVFLFCFVSIVIATFVINLLILFVSPHLYLFEKPVEMSEVVSAMPSTLLTAFMMGGVSLIPLFFGMRKKSTSATITWAVIIGVFINATVSDGEETVSLSQFIIIPIILCLFGFLVGYLSYRKVNQKDLL
ncbi:bacitracin ABC transporter permease [Bacillus velezensis]|uniref:ABC transporter permease n=1 Tax=Bacillus amyloliquefaciens group TaxID=1938374 RepID=UPI0006A87F51|nr:MULTISPECIES: ABC transporter permease [Bacillus amyloliquefaciens group]MEC3795957.1 ABC transporter permease [Bacillus velezensis]RXK30303.1 bacitracin ABC transporter permease [Bacillus velezensis]CUB24643.1 ABC-2 family transporter protein [Bacillus amyloliquefaciens]